MYCKKCGRRIKEGERFCDRCGQSVRAGEKQNNGQAHRYPNRQPYHENSELKRKRLELEKEKVQRKQKKQAHAKRRLFLLIASTIVVIAIGSGVISYQLTKKNSEATWKRTDESVQMNSTATPTPLMTQTPEASAAAAAVSPEPATQAPSDKIAGQVQLYKDAQNQFVCPYPEEFQSQAPENETTLLYRTDPSGGGSVRIGMEPNSQSKAADALLKEYAAAAGGTIAFSRAGTNWYTISIEKNGNLHHRKEYIVNGNLVYYEFTYDMTSSKKSDYDELIAYMDENFKLL